MPLFRSIERRHASLKIGRAESPIQQTPETVKPRPRKVGDGGRMSRSTNSLARYENLSRQRIHHICAWKTVRCCCRIGRHRMRVPSLVIREGVSATFSLLGTAVSCFHCYFSTVFAERCEAIAHAHGLRL